MNNNNLAYIKRLNNYRDKSTWLNDASFAAWWFEEADLKADVDKFEKRAQNLSAPGINAVITFGYHFRWDWVERLDEVELARIKRYGILELNTIKKRTFLKMNYETI